MSSDRFTEILNYLSAISREVAELRAEIKEMRAEIKEVRGEMRVNFEAVRGDVRHLARKVDVMNQDLLDLRANQRDLEGRMDALESKQA